MNKIDDGMMEPLVQDILINTELTTQEKVDKINDLKLYLQISHFKQLTKQCLVITLVNIVIFTLANLNGNLIHLSPYFSRITLMLEVILFATEYYPIYIKETDYLNECLITIKS